MEWNLDLQNVINDTSSLEDKEGYAVDFNGDLISSQGTACFGIVHEGRPADKASVAAVRGIRDVQVDGGTANISINDPLTAGGGSVTGQMTKATIGTHPIRAYAMEAATTQTTIKAYLV